MPLSNPQLFEHMVREEMLIRYALERIYPVRAKSAQISSAVLPCFSNSQAHWEIETSKVVNHNAKPPTNAISTVNQVEPRSTPSARNEISTHLAPSGKVVPESDENPRSCFLLGAMDLGVPYCARRNSDAGMKNYSVTSRCVQTGCLTQTRSVVA